MAILLHRRARELPAADHEDLAVVLLELLDEGNEVAVASDDDEGVDVAVREGHFERIKGHRDVCAVLVAAWGHVALHHADGVLRQKATVVARALPIAVRDLRNDLAALLYSFENEPDVELSANGVLDADLDVVKVDEHGDSVATGV